jgi:hypothetical protein
MFQQINKYVQNHLSPAGVYAPPFAAEKGPELALGFMPLIHAPTNSCPHLAIATWGLDWKRFLPLLNATPVVKSI